MAESIINDLIRIRIQQSITGPLAAGLGAMFGATAAAPSTAGLTGNSFGVGGYIPPRAEGGPVGAGRPYIVGERGPELFVPRSSGQIVPNGGGGVQNHFNVDMRGASADAVIELRRLVLQVNGSIETRAVNAVVNARQRGVSALRN